MYRTNLQTLIKRAKNFFDFADIILYPIKCEVIDINPTRTDKEIRIDIVEKEYIADRKCMKYLGVLMGTKRIR
jgi:hypothetical protein